MAKKKQSWEGEYLVEAENRERAEGTFHHEESNVKRFSAF